MAILRFSLFGRFGCLFFASAILLCGANPAASAEKPDYERARWDPIHFKPAIDTATDAQCLSCHQEIAGKEVLVRSPAGVEAAKSRAWYQRLSTYQGPQMDFHRRHIDGPMASQFMNMRCSTCHQGNDPREEVPTTTGQAHDAFTLRKAVNPEVCLMCHGQMEYTIMGLPEPWPKSSKLFANNCLTCHAAIRTTRHQVNFLKPEAIEQAGAKNGDVCYGCHGGRAWYRIGYKYPRHAWEGMAEEVPDWAKGRPSVSNPRFRNDGKLK
jgi:nitrate/TMAO reductase-like tetraheme cytochrome c subunit